MAFDYKYWLDTFLDSPGYNDTEGQVIVISPSNSQWRVIGIHKLRPDENLGNHHIFFDVRCKQGDRDQQRAVNWGYWNESAPPAYADKPDNETGNIAIFANMAAVWAQIQGADRLEGFRTDIAVPPNSPPGNSWGHHSIFVVWEEWSGQEPEPPIEPPISTAFGSVTLLVEKSLVDQLEPDSEGFVKIEGNLVE
jgi:hypothetical protein